MIEISVSVVGSIVFGMVIWFFACLAAMIAQFGDDEKRAITVSMIFASLVTVFYWLIMSGVIKFAK